MKTFRCPSCDGTVYFENTLCQKCQCALGYLPDERRMAALRGGPSAGPRPCRNYVQENVCNWLIPAGGAGDYCESCRLTQIIPALAKAENRRRWFLLERAKRYLVYSLHGLKLPIKNRADDPEHGLSFQFLEEIDPSQRVLTGHQSGIITLNVAEAEDAARETARARFHEPYRTLLGHFRHEVGHYYWDQLIANRPALGEFRAQFGDERQDYSSALQTHYNQGPPSDWNRRYISGYASSHPWEDWAETWAHYLLISDSLHTAGHWGFSLGQSGACSPATDFPTALAERWPPLETFLNSMNRTLGHNDAYPFVISPPAADKLCFVDRVVRNAAPTEAART